MLKKIASWVRDEKSASQTTENGMLMLGGIVLAVGVGYLVSQYMRDTGNLVLGNMETTAGTGIDPDTAPAGLGGNAGGWAKP